MEVAIGEVLAAVPADVEGAGITRSWKWFRDGVLIPGATTNSYVVTAYDLGTSIIVQQIETNEGGSAIAQSTAFEIDWTPHALFADGQRGAWWDIGDESTVYEDSEATILASLNGPIGYVQDKSGNGNHLIQTTSTYRPRLEEIGGVRRSYQLNTGSDLYFVNPPIFGSAMIASVDGVWVASCSIPAGTDRQVFSVHKPEYNWNTFNFNRTFYGGIVRDGEFTDAERERIDEWMAKRTGLATGASVFSTRTSMNSFAAQNRWIRRFEGVDTSNVTDGYRMLRFNPMMEVCDVDLSSNLNFYETWYANYRLKRVTGFATIAPTNATGLQRTFSQCWELEEIPTVDCAGLAQLYDTFSSCQKLKTFNLINTSGVTDWYSAFNSCFEIESFPSVDTSSATRMQSTWSNCIGMVTFPWIDTSNVTQMIQAWYNCYSLAGAFPAIDTSKATSLQNVWYNCANIESFGQIDMSACTDAYRAWRQCQNITSIDLVNVNVCTRFQEAFYSCVKLADVPAGIFDNCPATNYGNCFYNCALTAQSVENVFVSLVTAGRTGGLIHIQYGTSSGPGLVAQDAIDTLRARGWSVYHNTPLADLTTIHDREDMVLLDRLDSPITI